MLKLIRSAILAILLSYAPALHAQMQGGAGLNSVILKLFGKHDDFSLDADFEMKKTQVTLTMNIAVSGGKLRADADMSTYRGPGVSAELKAQVKELKAMGMDHVVSISRPDLNRLYRLYPGRKLYEEAAMPSDAAGSTNAIAKINKTPLARETIDGHPCIKNKVVLLDAKGRQQQMTVWEATDLKNFPIKVEVSEGGENMVVHNRNIRMVKPLATQFEVPAGYKKTKVVN